MIKCDFYDYDLKQWRQYELDLEMNIYPCCFFYLDKRLELNHKTASDTALDHIDNSLKTNKLETILKEFKKVLNENVWNSNKCPNLCKEKCEK